MFFTTYNMYKWIYTHYTIQPWYHSSTYKFIGALRRSKPLISILFVIFLINKFLSRFKTILPIIHNQNSKSSNSWCLGKLLAPLATSLDKIYLTNLRTRIIAVLCRLHLLHLSKLQQIKKTTLFIRRQPCLAQKTTLGFCLLSPSPSGTPPIHYFPPPPPICLN